VLGSFECVVFIGVLIRRFFFVLERTALVHCASVNNYIVTRTRYYYLTTYKMYNFFSLDKLEPVFFLKT